MNSTNRAVENETMDIAAEEMLKEAMPVRMYTTEWCGDCWRATRFLQSNKIGFEEIDIEQSEEAAELVMEHNQGKRRVPTFEINGAFYGNPPLSELARLVGAEQGRSQ